MIKKSKSKLLIYSSIALATVALATVGFSAWIIDGSVYEDDVNVNVTIDNMLDKTVLLKLNDQNNGSDFSVNFDYDKNSQNKNTHVIFDESETDDEDLTFVFKYTLTSNNVLNRGDYQVGIGFSKETITAFNGLNKNPYIDVTCLKDFTFTLPASSSTVNVQGVDASYITNNITYSNENKEATIVSTFNFKWGSYFNGKNPCEYGTGTNEKDYETKIKAFGTDVSGKKVEITSTISVSYVTE